MIESTSVTQILVTQAREWLKRVGARVDGAERLVNAEGRLLDPVPLQAQYELEMASVRARGVTEGMVKQALIVALNQLEEEHRHQTSINIAYNRDKVSLGTAELHKWLICVTGTDQELAVPLVILQHFIWQVKRKLSGLPVKYHLMPVFFGPQGTGKTTAINRLLQPLEKYTLSGKSVPEVCDSRNFRSLGQNFICFLDEMGRAERADVDSLKNVISNTTLNYRPLYSNRNAATLQNVTFIGASNKDLATLIKDPTGMRRFYQITCLPMTNAATRWSALTKLDVTAIWQAVDGAAESPILPWLSEVSEHQERIRVADSIEEFLLEYNLTAGAQLQPLQALYNKYKDFCSDTNSAPFGRQNFRRELEVAYGFTFQRTSKGLCAFTNKSALDAALPLIRGLK